MALSRLPRGDEIVAAPVDWEEVPMGVGQEPRPSSGFQHSKDMGVLPVGNDVRRDPADQTEIVLRWPERPY